MRSPALEAPGLPVQVQQARAWWGCRGLSCGYLLLKVILDIIANDASTGASPFDLAQVDGVLFSYMSRQRGCLDHFPVTTLFNRLPKARLRQRQMRAQSIGPPRLVSGRPPAAHF
jgi:hypothetical protein